MRPFSEIVYGFGMILRIIALVLTVIQIYCVIEAFQHRRRIVYRIFTAVQLAAGMLWFSALLDGSFTVDYADRVRSYPGYVSLIYNAPWLAVAVIDLLFAVGAAACLIGIIRFRRSNPLQESVKETVDMLPVGICFSQDDGEVMLKNLRMDRLSTDITGRSLGDASAFLSEAKARGEGSGDALFITDDSGCTSQLTCERVTVDGCGYDLMLASDVTEQYRITSSLKENNKKLIDIRLRMRAFGEEAAELAMSEEILRARVTVHDEVNHVLLSGKYCLDHPDTADGAQLIKTARYTNRLLTRESEEPDDARRDGYAESLDVARAVGVRVTVTGEPPEDETARELLGRAIRECAVNTVKHADGDSLSVELTNSGGRMCAVLRGGGSAPEAPITESGGLSYLRRDIEAAGGELTITCEPQVTLRIVI